MRKEEWSSLSFCGDIHASFENLNILPRASWGKKKKSVGPLSEEEENVFQAEIFFLSSFVLKVKQNSRVIIVYERNCHPIYECVPFCFAVRLFWRR